jgi:hypothetical protein
MGIATDRYRHITFCLIQNVTRRIAPALEVKFIIKVRKFENEFKMQASID